jgi:hypothetical protein
MVFFVLMQMVVLGEVVGLHNDLNCARVGAETRHEGGRLPALSAS